jgi:alpha-N-arabinofuranosidase
MKTNTNLCNLGGYAALFLTLLTPSAPAQAADSSSSAPAASATVARFGYFSYKGSDARFDRPIDRSGQYFNPIIAGFYPDPSICRKGDTYYLVNSSFSFYPGIPIFTSKDLVSWTQAGHVLDRPSQLLLTNQRVSGGIYAPDIKYNPHNDTFYMVTTGVYGPGNFFVKAQDPAGSWSDPVLLPEISGIDPSFFFDDNGKAYIVHNAEPEGKADWEQQRAIRMYEFDVASEKVVGSGREVVRGGARPEDKPIWIEGPHLYKVNGYYYLMCAEGGTDIDHSEVVFRSKAPWGPYAPYGGNPILTQRDLPDLRDDRVTCAGHADLVETPDGGWWAVFLACRPYEENLVNTGRETFLLPVEWRDEFPVILPQGKPIPTVVSKQGLPEPPPSAAPTTGNFTYRNEFDHPELDHSWIFLRTPRAPFYAIKNGELSITALPVSLDEQLSPSAIFRRQQHAAFEVETQLNFSPASSRGMAGFCLFQNEKYYIAFGKTMLNGVETLVLDRVENDKVRLAAVPAGAGKGASVRLKVVGKGRYCDFLYSFDGNSWQTLASHVDAANLSTRRAGGFTGACIGLFNYELGITN